jgi:hypothetical protein
MHGYDPHDPWSDAIFLSSSQPTVPVQAIADVYYCMRNAAGLDARIKEVAFRSGSESIQTDANIAPRNPAGSARA